MDKRQPIYPHSYDRAYTQGETDQYRESSQLNEECAQAIKKAIAENFDGYHLKHYTSDAVIQQFGLDRVKLVLASSIQRFSEDGRISQDNKAWAKTITIPDEQRDRMRYLVDGVHGLMDMWTKEVRQRESELLQVADQIIDIGRHGSTSGNYFINFEEAGKDILDPALVDYFKEDITSLMYGSDAVSDIVMTEDGEFDVCFYLAYTPNYEPWQEETDEYGPDWPEQEPLEPLSPARPNAEQKRAAEKQGGDTPSLLMQLRANQEEIKKTPSTKAPAKGKNTEMEV